MMPADLSAFINICARLNTSILYSDGMREVVEELWGDRLELAHSCRRRGREAELLAHLCEHLPAGVRDPHAYNVGLSTVATMRSRLVVASPALTSSTIMSIESPCARRIALV
jgi:hypothetical protein